MDLKLTPYKVLSTCLRHGKCVDLICFLRSTKSKISLGFVEYIENQTLGAVRNTDGSLKQYLQNKSTSPKENDIGIAEDVMNAYVKSCGMSIDEFCFF